MTNQEAIETIKVAISEVEWNYPMEYAVAFEKAIKALEKQIPKKVIREDIENGVIVPPCKVGDKIYVIPSKTNYRLNIANGHTENNRIYEQIVDAIHIYLTGYTMSCCEGLQHQPSALYGETWFLTKEEAEKALEEIKNV